MSAGSCVVARIVTRAVVEVREQPGHGARPGPVERRGRLVEDQELGFGDDRPGEGDPQPLAGGQAVGCALGVVAEPEALECRAGPVAGIGAVEAADRQPELDVLARGQERHEVADLVDDADARRPEPGQARRGRGRRSVSSVTTRPVGRAVEAGERRSSVVLPLPDGPVTTWNRRAGTRRVVGGRPSDPATAWP